MGNFHKYTGCVEGEIIDKTSIQFRAEKASDLYRGNEKLVTPAGCMLKKVMPRPEWIKADSVVDVFSLSNCISDEFADYIKFWKHNGYWLFDSSEVLTNVARSEGIDTSSCTLFYYEVFEEQYDEGSKRWSEFKPEPTFSTNIIVPKDKTLEGFDVVTFSAGSCAECSPLSCNSLATEIDVNEHCLFRTFNEAKTALEAGKFDDSEPGPFRVFAVYRVGCLEE